jgi:hypothetical protein
MAVTINAAGRMKHLAITRPIGPPHKCPMNRQLSRVRARNQVRGAQLVKEFLSREPFRRTTTSSSIIAMCAAGPPKAIVPSFRNTPAMSRRETLARSKVVTQ